MFAKDRIKAQTATSAAKVPEPPKPTTPWKEAELTAPPPGCNVPPGWGARWVRTGGNRKDDERIAGKLAEGWQIYDKTNPPWGTVTNSTAGKSRATSAGDNHVDGSDLTSASLRRGLVFMVLSPERKAARDYHQWQLNQQRMEGLKDPKAEEMKGEGK